MLQLPKDYLSYLEAGGSDSGFTEGDPGYFQLWALKEGEALNRDYKVDDFAPGFIGFGSDGGGEMLAFDGSGAVFMIPFVGDGVEDAKKIANTWSEIVSRFTNEEKA
jgi:hypothetical protein